LPGEIQAVIRVAEGAQGVMHVSLVQREAGKIIV
jgi:hypothetical protein